MGKKETISIPPSVGKEVIFSACSGGLPKKNTLESTEPSLTSDNTIQLETEVALVGVTYLYVVSVANRYWNGKVHAGQVVIS